MHKDTIAHIENVLSDMLHPVTTKQYKEKLAVKALNHSKSAMPADGTRGGQVPPGCM